MLANRCWTGVKILSLITLLFVLTGYAAQQDAGTAVTLAYKFPDGKTISYRQATNEKQYMQIGGQDMTTTTQSSLEFSAKPKGMKEGNFGLSVTIDAMKMSIQGPQGDMVPDFSQIVGKAFDMMLSRLGKELDTSGAAALKYQLGPTGQRDMSSSFQAFFPDLPDRPIKKGESWPSRDTVSQKTGNGDILVNSKYIHTVDGFETLDGLECARIKTSITGTLTGNLQEGGVGLTLDCKIEGTGTWYFAIKEGILVKLDNKGTFTGAVTAGDPANVTIPLSGETVEETRLIKK